MKTLTLATQKGGVGKTAIGCQFALYLRAKGLRVLVIDLDHQGNLTGALQRGGIAAPCPTPASALFTSHVESVSAAKFVVIGADGDELLDLESQGGDRHNDFATNFNRSLSSLSAQFDACIVDVNPAPDIRQLSALIASTHVVCPVQLSQESIEGVGHALNSPKNGIYTIRDAFNPSMDFMGLLVNLVEPTPFQQANLQTLVKSMGPLLIRVGDGFAAIKKSTAIFEAQSAGVPVWTIKKDSARNAWRNIEPVFKAMATRMGLAINEPATQD